MAEPYFTGDNVPLKFEITDAEGGVNPSTVSVVICYPRNSKLTEPADADIDGNTVTYTVPLSATTMPGEYHAFFVCTIPAGVRTYQMNFAVLDNPR